MVLLFFQLKLKMAVHAPRTKKKMGEVYIFCPFLIRVNLNLMFFQEELASLLSEGKPLSRDLEGDTETPTLAN